MKEPKQVTSPTGKTRWACGRCSTSWAAKADAEACCARMYVHSAVEEDASGPKCTKCGLLWSDEQLAASCCDKDTFIAPEGVVPDHWSAAADLLMYAVEQLRTNSMSPEDVGDYVVRVGRLMRRQT